MNKKNMRGNNSFDSSLHAKKSKKINRARSFPPVSYILAIRKKIANIIDTNLVSSYGKIIPAAVFVSSMAVVGIMSKSQMDIEIQTIQ
jgi:hypothetical protein